MGNILLSATSKQFITINQKTNYLEAITSDDVSGGGKSR
jgi:hypothetical protein